MKYTTIHSKNGSDICQHLPVLYDLVVELAAKVVIECGVRDGESTVALAEAVHQTGGKLWSVDVLPCEKAVATIKSYGLSGRWTFVRADDVEFLEKWDRSVPVDLIFVDTSHQAAHTKRETEALVPLLRPGGAAAFHDTCSFYDGVAAPVLAFMKANPGFQFKNYDNCNGLGVLRKPE